MLGSGPRGKLMQFVYDVPGLIDEGKAPPIFKATPGPDGYELEVKSKRTAEVYGTPAKNARGDLPAILLTPDTDPDYGEMEPQSLAMTRSIGDFYMQTFGVSWRPEVISVDLEEVGAELQHLTLILASDGVWDLWEYEDVFQSISCARPGGQRGPAQGSAKPPACTRRGAAAVTRGRFRCPAWPPLAQLSASRARQVSSRRQRGTVGRRCLLLFSAVRHARRRDVR